MKIKEAIAILTEYAKIAGEDADVMLYEFTLVANVTMRSKAKAGGFYYGAEEQERVVSYHVLAAEAPKPCKACEQRVQTYEYDQAHKS